MKGLKYLVLGTGVGKAIAYYLAKSADTEKVVLADINHNLAVTAISKLALSQEIKAKLIPVSIDVSFSPISLLQPFFSKFDVIISALPAQYNFVLADLATKAGTHFCDLGGVLEITQKILRLNMEAEEKNLSLIPDCGLMPGLGMMLSKLLIEEFDKNKVHDLVIYAGGLPQNPKPPYYYQRIYSIEGLEHICYDKSMILKNGKVQYEDPFSGYEQLKIKELSGFSTFNGVVEIFNTAGASISPWSFQRLGVENFSEKTVRWPGFVESVSKIKREDFKSIMTDTLQPTNRESPDLVWMNVEAMGISDGKTMERSVRLLDLFDFETNFSAMERTTGFTTAIIARMAAQGKTNPGVNTPDNALDYKQMSDLCAELSHSFKINSKETTTL